MRQHKKIRPLLVIAVLAVAAVVTAGCGGGSSSKASASNEVDKAFVGLMVPHHMSALEMADMAKMKGLHPQIKTLALNIVSTQNAEIDQMKGIAKDIGADVESGSMSGMDHGSGDSMGDAENLKTLGLTQNGAGMSMDMTALGNAKPFDRTFIDMMVAHHMGAISMAKVELAKGVNPGLKSIAQKIIGAQQKELTEMNSWRTNWYGGPAPATG